MRMLQVMHDIVMAVVALLAALVLRFGYDGLPPWQDVILLCSIFGLSAGISYRLFGLDGDIWLSKTVSELRAIVPAATLTVISFLAAAYMLDQLSFVPRQVPLVTWLVLITLLGVSRVIYRIVGKGGSRTAIPIAIAFFTGWLSYTIYGGAFPGPQDNATRELSPSADVIETSASGLRVSRYESSASLDGWGGGLALIEGKVIGVDRNGNFFEYQGQGKVHKLTLSIETHQDEYLEHLAQYVTDIDYKALLERRFRVLGIASRTLSSGQLEIFISHNNWDEQNSSKTTRVSRLVVDDVDALRRVEMTSSADWQLVYETDPIEFDDRARQPDDHSPFHSDRMGGRMVFTCEGALLLSTGDHNYDGFWDTSMLAGQDMSSSYGKIIRIDPENPEQSDIYALGFRNPQGMYVDRDCGVWATEHGPTGGDELNLITANANYGWPRVTFGRAHDSYEWPLSQTQGRHDGFAKPQFAWVPSIAISSVIQIQSGPEPWRGDLLAGSLRAASLFRIKHEAGRVVFVEPIMIGERIRDLVETHDGTIIVWTDSGSFVEIVATSEKRELPVELSAQEEKSNVGSALDACLGCHTIGPDRADHGSEAGVAPGLWQIHEREIASEEFSYTHALRSKRGIWDHKSLNEFLSDPQRFAPGTSMPAPVLAAETREALVGYLSRLK